MQPQDFDFWVKTMTQLKMLQQPVGDPTRLILD
jgi:hypothetical protein